jgi:membrane protein
MNREALKPSNLWSMTKETFASWSDDFAPSMGAAISYYTVFSLAPLLVITIAIAGFAFGREAASGQLYEQVAGLVGDQGASAVQTMVEHVNQNWGQGIFATIVGVIVLLIGATGVFAELQNDLDRIWRSPAAQKKEGIWNMIRGRLLSLGMVLSIGFLLLVSLAVSAALSALGKWWGGLFGQLEWLLQVVNFLVSIGVITVLFALMYKILPRVPMAWPDVWIGSLVTAVLFTIGKFAVGLYLGKSSVASGFGAAGSLAVLLVWVYYSAQIFLLGAEFTGVYAHRYGSRKGEARPKSARDSMATTDAPHGVQAAADAERKGRQPGTVPLHGGVPAPASSLLYPPDAMPANAPSMVARTLRRPRPQAAATGGFAATLRHHPGYVAGGALLLGAIAGEVVNRMQSSRRRAAQRSLVAELAQLRAALPAVAPVALRAVRRKAAQAREALPSAHATRRTATHAKRQALRTLQEAQRAAADGQRTVRQAARREAGKAASATADASHRLRNWIVRHLPWRKRSVIARLRQRAAEVAHGA